MNERRGRGWLTPWAALLWLGTGLWMMPAQAASQSEGWTPPVAALKKTLKVVSYRARLAGEILVIEAAHEPGWHTYALDNLERAKKRGGEPALGIESPTQIQVGGGLKVAGRWRQSAPKDLSQREINWFTWGFEGTTLFAVKVERTGDLPEALITINGQACQADSCAMIEDLELRLPLGSRNQAQPSFNLDSLIEQGDLTDVRE
ncbi:MAG TPA: hypothetical protein VJ302_06270 [Blastocatellia bacterium]|nr:hypothetical protein [Blastocatellia bacterium]